MILNPARSAKCERVEKVGRKRKKKVERRRGWTSNSQSSIRPESKLGDDVVAYSDLYLTNSMGRVTYIVVGSAPFTNWPLLGAYHTESAPQPHANSPSFTQKSSILCLLTNR